MKIVKSDDYLRYMCDVIPIQDIRHIYGPVSYTEHTKNGKVIGVFGEYHKIPKSTSIDKTNTVSVASLLKLMLAARPDRFYDLFLEMSKGYFYSHVFDPFFSECLKVVKRCPYNNLRAHYADYRDMIADPIWKSFVDKFQQIIYYFDEVNDNDPYFTIVNLEHVYSSVITAVVASMRSDAKLNKSQNAHINGLLFRFFEKLIRDHIQDTRSLWFNNNYQFTKRSAKAITNRIMDIFAFYMDMYLLLRVFKTYDTSRNPTHPSTANYCLIYVGDAHAETYRKFLTEEMGFALTNSQRAEDTRLINFIPTQSALFM